MEKYSRLPLFFYCIFLLNCKSSSIELKTDLSRVPSINSFESFYQKFHTDSAYQLSHIGFPLQGMPEQSDTFHYVEGFTWKAASWILHKPFNDKDSLFQREFHLLDSTLVLESFYHQKSPMKLERRFSYDGNWKLIYYAPLRIPVTIEIN